MKPDASDALDLLSVNTIRALSIDGVQRANSGHPGLPLGAAPMAYVLWTRIMRHNPRNPKWANRDRFVFSPGHGSMLLYSLLHLTGYDLSMDDLKAFRQWGSRTPGHPEYGVTPGVELTTGPLGQGFANGVGLAMAEAHLAAAYNRDGHAVVDHHTYGIVSDGDLMEGVASEAASLAGHLRLGKLIYLYDHNEITLAASANLSFTEDVGGRFEAMRWQVLRVADGNDLGEIERAVEAARQDTGRPTLVVVRTTIGFGSPKKQGTFEVHGSPLGADEVVATKRALGWPTPAQTFVVPAEVRAHFQGLIQRGEVAEREWTARFDEYRSAFPDLAVTFDRTGAGTRPEGWDARLPRFDAADGAVATRSAGGKVINAVAAALPELIGGSADLNPSTNTALKEMGDFQGTASVEAGGEAVQGAVGGVWGYAGRNVHFGVREHAMGAITNGLAYHGGLIPYSATFLVFSDYMRPAMRLAALSELGSIFVFTHDSIGLGEDGPTHQPVEHLAALRAIPNMVVFRPADANEVVEGWRVAVERRHGPTTLVFSRQALPVFERGTQRGACAPAEGARRGAYVLADPPGGQPAEVLLIGTGSEVAMAMEARALLEQEGVPTRVVSMPSWELFQAESAEYRESVLPARLRARVAVEAGVPLGWERWVGELGDVVGLTRFGASAPHTTLYEQLGFTPAKVAERARVVLERAHSSRMPTDGAPDGSATTGRASFEKAAAEGHDRA